MSLYVQTTIRPQNMYQLYAREQRLHNVCGGCIFLWDAIAAQVEFSEIPQQWPMAGVDVAWCATRAFEQIDPQVTYNSSTF